MPFVTVKSVAGPRENRTEQRVKPRDRQAPLHYPKPLPLVFASSTSPFSEPLLYADSSAFCAGLFGGKGRYIDQPDLELSGH